MKENPSRSTEIKGAETAHSDALAIYPKQERALAKPTAIEKKSLFGRRKQKAGPTGEHIRRILFENLDAFPTNEARMLRGIFSLSTTSVREVMVPLSEVMAVHIATPTDQVKAILQDSNCRFIPVYEDRIDRLTGIINILDILYATRDTNELSSFVRPAYCVPETKITADLLEELRSSADPVAIVIDEHAGCVGFVTLEDIFEQIVGEIGYNHKRHTLHAESLGKGLWSLDARTSIDIVNEELGANIPKGRCDTIGGFILMLLGRLPEQGEKIDYGGIEFTVEEVFGYGIAVLHATRVNPSRQGKKRSK